MTGPNEISLEVAGQKLLLLPERAAFWVEQETLLLADAHWGKAATFRTAGVPVPRGTTSDALLRLDAIIERLPVRRVLFLGDLLHAREGRAARTLNRIREWRGDYPDLELILVRGNHDRRAGDPPDDLGIRCVDEPFLGESAFAFNHYPNPVETRYAIGGHIHPAVKLRGKGRQRARLPCFWFQPRIAVLPAFGDFTGAALIDSGTDDRVFVVAAGEVVEVG